MGAHHSNRALGQLDMQKRRLRAIRYFEKNWSERRIAGALNVSAPSVHAWKVAWKTRGQEGLRAGKYGPKFSLSREEQELVKAKVIEGPDVHGFSGSFWTLGRIQICIKQWTGVHYHHRSLSRVLRRLGFSHQVGVRKVLVRDDIGFKNWLAKNARAFRYRGKRGPRFAAILRFMYKYETGMSDKYETEMIHTWRLRGAERAGRKRKPPKLSAA
jgi:transposase